MVQWSQAGGFCDSQIEAPGNATRRHVFDLLLCRRGPWPIVTECFLISKCMGSAMIWAIRQICTGTIESSGALPRQQGHARARFGDSHRCRLSLWAGSATGHAGHGPHHSADVRVRSQVETTRRISALCWQSGRATPYNIPLNCLLLLWENLKRRSVQVCLI